MALQDILEQQTDINTLKHIAELTGGNIKTQKIGLSEERLEPIKEVIRQYVSYWREYPDMFVDFLQTGWRDDVEPKLKFYFYQRVFLRAAIRYKYVYFVFPRAYEYAPMWKSISTDKLL